MILSKMVAAAGAMLLAASASAVTTVTVEAAGVQTTTVAGTTGVETFDGVTNHYTSPYSTTFGGSGFAGTFDSVLADDANSYGGAGGTGRYVTSQGTVTLTLTGAPTDYFGLWASALDGGNAVAFYKGGALIDTISLVTFPLGDAYSGNPNPNFVGQDSTEKFAFFNFVVAGGYDEVRIVQNNGGGFEFDNVTVGTTAAVPEPATWGLMMVGLGLVGLSARRRSIAV